MLKLIRYVFSLLYWNHQSVEKIRKMQLQKFKKMFEYAREYSPFYKELYSKAGIMDFEIKTWEDVNKVPIIDKEMMRKYQLSDTMTCPLETKGIVHCSTSGSTGQPFELAYSSFANNVAYIRVFYVMWKTFHYNPLKKMVILSKYEENEEFKIEKNLSLIKKLQKALGLFPRKIISVYKERQEIVDEIRKSKPFVLYSSSSAVEIIANFVIETNQSLTIPNIVLIAEPLSKSQFEKFRKTFNTNNIVDIYGAKESPSLGYEVNKEGVFHLFPQSNLFEFIDIQKTENGNQGTTVITNLINNVQPFIRYNLKDYSLIKNCDGMGTTVIGPIEGRISDILSFPDGNKLFHYGISQRFIDFHMAAQYKFIQINNGPIKMQILPMQGFSNEEVKKEAMRRWNLSYSKYGLEIEIVDHFEIDKKTGKFKVIEHIYS